MTNPGTTKQIKKLKALQVKLDKLRTEVPREAVCNLPIFVNDTVYQALKFASEATERAWEILEEGDDTQDL